MTLHRRLARLEDLLARTRLSADDEADDAALREWLGTDTSAGLKAGKIDPVSLMPAELLAYLNGDPTPLPPGLAAWVDGVVAAHRGNTARGRRA
jgi:hypothetical protein